MLVASKSGKPSQANLRRATSTIYYALFHCLARSVADLLVGGSNAVRSKSAWQQAYRALEHGSAKNACKDQRVLKKFPKDVEDFANQFVTMQAKRHKADYDPFGKFYKSAVLQDLADAEDVIKRYQAAAIKDRRAFAAFVVFKPRKD